MMKETGVEDSQIPTEYKLEQNYPNPFNPSTRIEFSLFETSNVSIRIYNSLGKTIEIISAGLMIHPSIPSLPRQDFMNKIILLHGMRRVMHPVFII